jgi:hypothetical protein
VVEPVTPVDPVVTLPAREVSWGRWSTIAGQADATTGLSKAGAERIGLNEDYVLFRSTSGSAFVTPEKGSVAFNLASGEGYIHDIGSTVKSPVALSNGELSFDFGKATFATRVDVTTQAAETIKLASDGKIGTDGVFSSTNRNLPTANMTVTGVMTDLNGATYIFQGSPDAKRIVNGVTVWTK